MTLYFRLNLRPEDVYEGLNLLPDDIFRRIPLEVWDAAATLSNGGPLRPVEIFEELQTIATEIQNLGLIARIEYGKAFNLYIGLDAPQKGQKK